MNAARSSTATATTATADPGEITGPGYRGRFAPSPTGLLHAGSLAAALASYLEARHRRGCWLLRIEDVDTPRSVPGAADAILRSLERLGFEWDENVVWQSRRIAAYQEALSALAAAGRLYPCRCTRGDWTGPYPGTCRHRADAASGPQALRFALDPGLALDFEDRWQGRYAATAAGVGDPVVRRRDGLIAYQLAVVVDDGWQRVTDVVRGADLLDSTPWQLALQVALGLPRPGHAHLPLVTEPDGSKLAKSRRSLPLDVDRPGETLLQGLQLLGQAPPAELASAAPAEVMAWAIEHWNPSPLRHRAQIAAPDRHLGSPGGVL